MSSSGGSLAGRTVRGVLWNYGSFALSKGSVLVATAVLARLLTPEEFGVVAVATVAVTFMTVLQGMGLGQALIHRRGDIEQAASVVFTLNLMLGVALSAIAYLIAPFVAAFFHEEAATAMLRVLGMTFVIDALGAVHLVRLQRELRFGRVFVPDVGRSVIKGVVSVTLALAGMGAWSLIIGQLVGVAAGVLLSWAVFPWRPTFMYEGELARRLIGYGLPLLGVEITWVVSVNLDYVIIGRQLGSEPLGIYTLAYRLPELLVLSLMTVVNRVVFPAFATMQDQKEDLTRGFLTAVRYVVLITLPLSVGLAVAADPIVRVALGSDWLEAIPVMRVIAVFVLISSLVDADGDVYKAIGRPGLLFTLAIVHVTLLVPALLIGVQHGLIGVAYAHLAVTAITRVMRTIVVARFLEIPIRRIAEQWKSAFIGGLLLVILAGGALYATRESADLVRLIAAVFAGVVGYVSVMWLREKDTIADTVRLIRQGGERSSV